MLTRNTANVYWQVYRSAQLHSLLAAVYQLCRVRGYKTVVKLLPHEVCDLEPVLHLLQSQDRCDAPTWESRYTLLLWLAMLCLVPFDISTIDSSIGSSSSSSSSGATSSSSSSSSGTLVGSIVALCTQYLGDAAVTRSAAAVCLSSLLTRPDMEGAHLEAFVQWTAGVLCSRAALSTAAADELTAITFELSGAMATLAAVFKKGERGRLVAAARVVLAPLCAVAAQASHDTLLKKMVSDFVLPCLYITSTA
jgi:tubulin-specific chaperone D